MRRRANTVPSLLLASAVSLAAAPTARAQTADAIDPYADGRAAAPAAPAVPADEDIDQVVARALYRQALALFEQGRFTDARQLAFESLARSPDGADAGKARQLRARCEERLGRAADRPAALPALQRTAQPIDPYVSGKNGPAGPVDPYSASTRVFDGPIDPYSDGVPAGELLDPYSARFDVGARLALAARARRPAR